MSIKSEEFMRLALAEGKRASPPCLPNPPVGCVLVKAGVIIARGHTQPPGLHHADAIALSQGSGDLKVFNR